MDGDRHTMLLAHAQQTTRCAAFLSSQNNTSTWSGRPSVPSSSGIVVFALCETMSLPTVGQRTDYADVSDDMGMLSFHLFSEWRQHCGRRRLGLGFWTLALYNFRHFTLYICLSCRQLITFCIRTITLRLTWPAQAAAEVLRRRFV